MTADSDPKVSPTSDDLTRYLANYLRAAVREWYEDFMLGRAGDSDPLREKMLTLVAALKSYADAPPAAHREALAEMMDAAGGLSGALSDLYRATGADGLPEAPAKASDAEITARYGATPTPGLKGPEEYSHDQSD